MVENGSSQAPHVAEGTMHAWLDGALSADESAGVDAHIAACATCASAAAEARGLIAASTRILSTLDDVPGGVIPVGTHPAIVASDGPTSTRRRAQTNGNIRAFAAIAAAAVIMVATTFVLRGKSTSATPAAPAAAPSVAARSTDAGGVASADAGIDASVDAAPTGKAPKSSGAIASAVRKRAASDEASKPGVPIQQVPRSQAGSVAVPGAVAASLGGRSVASSTDSLTVTGRVTAAATGLPLADARVSVAGTDAVAATDSTGTFTVSVPPTGSHLLMARKIGFAARSAVVNLPADQTAKVTLALPNSATMLADVVANGVMQRTEGFTKPLPSIEGTRMVSSDVRIVGGTQVRRTIFQLDSGASVTLEERRSLAAAPPPKSRFDTPSRADTSVRAAPLVVRAPSGPPPQQVMWLSSDGTLVVLSGQLPLERLEKLKQRVVF